MDSLDLEALRHALGRRDTHREELPEGAVRAAVALVLLNAPGAESELLLIRRADRPGDPWSGHMALPGGRAEDRDPDLATTACREAREETGVRLDPRAELVGELDDLRPTKSNRPRIVVRPFVFALTRRPPIRIQASEVAYHRWVPLSELDRSRAQQEVQLGPRRLLVPGFRLGDDFVWGMTHRILDPFLGLLPR